MGEHFHHLVRCWNDALGGVIARGHLQLAARIRLDPIAGDRRFEDGMGFFFFLCFDLPLAPQRRRLKSGKFYSLMLSDPPNHLCPDDFVLFRCKKQIPIGDIVQIL